MRTLAGGETFGGRFDIVAEAGRGGMGTVFEAVDRTSGERVALKVVTSAADHERFQREAEVLESLAHVAIVRYVCHGTTSEGHPYLAMEWLRGESVSARLERGTLAVADAITMGERIAGALAYAHARGVVHRDLKPSNVYLRDGSVERATLIDFGVAKTDDKNLTSTGQMLGTPGYMAPEQVRGERGIDQRVDVFALGCVLYESLAGTAPFDGGEVMEVLSRLLLEKPAPIIGVAPRISQLIDAMLVKDSMHRLASCDVIAEELATIGRALATGDRATLNQRSPAIPAPPPDTLSRAKVPSFPLHTSSSETVRGRPSDRSVPKSRTGLWVAIAVLGAVIGGAVGAYLVLRREDRSPVTVERPVVVEKTGPPITTETCHAPEDPGCKVLCERGDAMSCVTFADGLVLKDRKAHRTEALAAYERACKKLHAGCVGVAILLLDERTQANIDRAATLLGAACQGADEDGCRILAEYARTNGPWPDVASAYQLLGASCGQYDDLACAALREMIEVGEGTARQRQTARQIADAVCRDGIAEACAR